MLFALVVATLAQRSADLLYLITDGWTYFPFGYHAVSNLFRNDWQLMAGVSHATLGFLVVSVSWVGWSKSEAAGHREDINGFVSWSFLLLLLEVLLVTFYFGVASSIELEGEGANVHVSLSPSAVPESLLLALVFTLYFIWDLIADVFKSPIAETLEDCGGKRPSFALQMVTGSITYGSSSLLCIVLCLIVYYVSMPIGFASPKAAVAGDLALIFVVFLFRSLKSIEGLLIKVFPWEGTRNNSVRTTPLAFRNQMYIVIPLLMYMALVTYICVITNICR